MIEEIRIRDLGVIDDAVLPLHPGLTVLTGETGAGKTMVVTGLGPAPRWPRRLRRWCAPAPTGSSSRACVDLPAGHPALERAAEAGADVSDGLVLVRSVSADGRSRAHVGGRAAPVGVLAELAEHLVAVHGQADQWRLRRADQHREVLDAFGGPRRRRRPRRLPRPAHRAAPRPRPSSPTCAPPPPSGPARRSRCASGSSASRRSTRSRARTTRCGIESERLGHAEELRDGRGRRAHRPRRRRRRRRCRRRACSRHSPPRRPGSRR